MHLVQRAKPISNLRYTDYEKTKEVKSQKQKIYHPDVATSVARELRADCLGREDRSAFMTFFSAPNSLVNKRELSQHVTV